MVGWCIPGSDITNDKKSGSKKIQYELSAGINGRYAAMLARIADPSPRATSIDRFNPRDHLRASIRPTAIVAYDPGPHANRRKKKRPLKGVAGLSPFRVSTMKPAGLLLRSVLNQPPGSGLNYGTETWIVGRIAKGISNLFV